MFLGTHTPRLDDKARLVLPAKWRDQLLEGVVMTKGQEHCLYVFPMATFTRLSDALADTPVTGRELRDYSRNFFSAAYHEVPDRQGRVTVPQGLRTYAGLTRDCSLVGANTRFEIWDSLAWDAYLESTETAFAERSEEVLPGVL